MLKLKIGNKYKDDENFIWEVRRSEKGEIVIECDDLTGAIESPYPRLNYCELVS